MARSYAHGSTWRKGIPAKRTCGVAGKMARLPKHFSSRLHNLELNDDSYGKAAIPKKLLVALDVGFCVRDVLK